jgi:hypothetical protein
MSENHTTSNIEDIFDIVVVEEDTTENVNTVQLDSLPPEVFELFEIEEKKSV